MSSLKSSHSRSILSSSSCCRTACTCPPIDVDGASSLSTFGLFLVLGEDENGQRGELIGPTKRPGNGTSSRPCCSSGGAGAGTKTATVEKVKSSSMGCYSAGALC